MERNSWGVSVFCDDFRSEVGGKYSLMGVYDVDMVIAGEFPLILPKFVIFVKYYEVRGAFAEDWTVNIFLPGDDADMPSISSAIARNQNPSIPFLTKPEDSEALIGFTAPFVFGNFLVKEEGLIKVRVKCGAETTRMGTLIVRKITSEEQATWFASQITTPS